MADAWKGPHWRRASTAISACEKDEQGQQAPGFLEVMQKTVLVPDVISYSAAMRACENGEQGHQAFGLQEIMQKTGWVPDVSSHSADMGAEQAVEEQKVQKNMSEPEQEVEVQNVQTNISEPEQAWEEQKVQKNMSEPEQVVEGLEPSVITHATLISTCEKGRKAENAMITYDSPITACEEGHKMSQAMELDELQPVEVTYNARIRACGQYHWVEKAMELIAEMQQIGLIPIGSLSMPLSVPARRATRQIVPLKYLL